MPPMTVASAGRWPSLPVAAWEPTRDTLQLLTQIVGKVRMTNTPLVNHWWNVVLYVTARGLTTSLIPHPVGPSFQIDFHLLDHELQVSTDKGERRSLRLASRPVADYYSELMASLDKLGVGTQIWPMPVEIEGAILFSEDRGTVPTSPTRRAGSGWALLSANGSSRHSGPVSWARRALCICSGAHWTSPSRDFPGVPHRRIRAAHPTVGRRSCMRRTPTR